MKALRKDMLVKEDMVQNALDEKKILQTVHHPCQAHLGFPNRDEVVSSALISARRGVLFPLENGVNVLGGKIQAICCGNSLCAAPFALPGYCVPGLET